MASTKRELPREEEEEDVRLKKPKIKQTVTLNPADCDLDFDVEENGLRGQGLYEEGFAYCWSGARANVGIRAGKYSFGCKIISAQPVVMEDTPPDQQNVCRIGISRGDDAVGSLGETLYSFGYGGTGKFSNAGKFSNYGETFGVGDTIVCTVDLESKKPLASIGFYKNGKWLGVAREFNAGKNGYGVVDCDLKERKWGSAFFPHILLKNVVVEMQFSVDDGLVIEGGHKSWDRAIEDGNAIVGPDFGNTKDCEVLMMVGLPASGKTTWAEKWVKDHPEKRYLLLGTNLALDQMKVPGLLRKQNYGERFDRLMDRATKIFNTLMDRAAKTPRNYIIDQTNVYKNARKRKLRPFFQYQKIAVVVFPKPDVLKFRAEKRFQEMGKEVPAEAVNEMLANYVLPTSKDMLRSDEHFDQVWFPELNREDSQRYLGEMKRALQSSSKSPYPSKSSSQSVASPSPQKVLNGRQSYNSPVTQAAYANPLPQQVMSSAYPSMGLQGQTQYGYGHGLEYGSYGMPDHNRGSTSEGRSPVSMGRIGYGGVSSYGEPYSESRNYLRASGPVPYQSHGEVQSYSRSPSELSSTYGTNYGSPRTLYSSDYGSSRTSYPYSSPGYPQSASREPVYNPQSEQSSTFGSSVGGARPPLSYNSPGYSRFDSPVPREAALEPYSAKSGAYASSFGRSSTSLPYSHPGEPYPSSHGVPYGAPPPTRPYGNVPPTGMQQSPGFFSQPGQRHY